MLSRTLIVFGVLSMIVLAAPAVMAQEDYHSHDTELDNTVAPLVVPASGDFLPETGEDDEEGSGAEKSGEKVGVNTYVDVSEHMKAGVVTPFYRFSPKFAMKAHVPIIWNMTRSFFGTDVTAKGLGDITLDGEYTHALSSPGALLRFSASVKLPPATTRTRSRKAGPSTPCPWAPVPPTTSSRASTPSPRPSGACSST
jgi:hypothetical protein